MENQDDPQITLAAETPKLMDCPFCGARPFVSIEAITHSHMPGTPFHYLTIKCSSSACGGTVRPERFDKVSNNYRVAFVIVKQSWNSRQSQKEKPIRDMQMYGNEAATTKNQGTEPNVQFGQIVAGEFRRRVLHLTA
jgi:hypothetical protein